MNKIIAPIAILIGYIVNFIYNGLYAISINDVGVTIIVFTIVVYMIMLPLTYKQQKFSKMTAKIQPELTAIQNKYKGKTDTQSRMAMNEETQYLYDKYGVNPMGSCLPLLIQFPILIAVYRVALSVGEYVDLKGSEKAYNYFIGLNITNTPLNIIKQSWSDKSYLVLVLAVLVPILSGLTQWISIKISMAGQNNMKDNPAAKSMATMNVFMPLFSVVMVFSLPVAAGVYWIMGAVVRTVQMYFLNKHFDKIDFDAIIEKNKEKAEKKREKREGYSKQMIQSKGTMSTRNYVNTADNEEAINKSNELRKTAKAGSLASKANLVSDYNNRNNHDKEEE